MSEPTPQAIDDYNRFRAWLKVKADARSRLSPKAQAVLRFSDLLHTIRVCKISVNNFYCYKQGVWDDKGKQIVTDEEKERIENTAPY